MLTDAAQPSTSLRAQRGAQMGGGLTARVRPVPPGLGNKGSRDMNCAEQWDRRPMEGFCRVREAVARPPYGVIGGQDL